MTDDDRDQLHDRRWDDGAPITIGELARRFDRHEQQSDRLHRDQLRMINKLDDRTDTLATRITVVFSVVAVLWALFLVIAPLLRTLLGVPGG